VKRSWKRSRAANHVSVNLVSWELVTQDIERFHIQFFGGFVDANQIAGIGCVTGAISEIFAQDLLDECRARESGASETIDARQDIR
jgi:hypothetical protein